MSRNQSFCFILGFTPTILNLSVSFCYIQQTWVNDVLRDLKEKVSTSLLLRCGSKKGAVTSRKEERRQVPRCQQGLEPRAGSSDMNVSSLGILANSGVGLEFIIRNCIMI